MASFLNKTNRLHITYYALLFVALWVSPLVGESEGVFAQNALQRQQPTVYSDVPDIDVIRVGSDYYMVSTTMHLFPGVPIMKSSDLVNWKIISYVVPEIKDSPAYDLTYDPDLKASDVYGAGQWATSLRYNNGKFYVLFATNRPQKTYIYSATDPAGKWEKVMDLKELHHDTGLFFDDDGKVYIAGAGGGVRIQQLKSDLSGIDKDGLDVKVVDGPAMGYPSLLEGTHLTKINGKYYIFMIWWNFQAKPGDHGRMRTEVCFRSDKIEGPYEHQIIMEDDISKPGGGVAQGCIVDTPEGDWYGIMFQDHGAAGRMPYLLDCKWVDGWPMLSELKSAKINTPITAAYAVSDEFSRPATLDPAIYQPNGLKWEWQWNHNPDNSLWSLTERSGYLRLKTGKIVEDIFHARNTIGQRTEGPKCSGTVAIDVKKMKDGDICGLSSYCAEPGIIQVQMEGKKKFLVMKDRDAEKARVQLKKNYVYLRADFDFSQDPNRPGNTVDICKFYYSLDNKTWQQLGTDFHMVYNLKHFMGNRFSIFNYATKQAGGYIDIDFFDYKKID